MDLFSAKGISQNRKAAFTQNDQKHYVESLGGNEKGSHARTDSKRIPVTISRCPSWNITNRKCTAWKKWRPCCNVPETLLFTCR